MLKTFSYNLIELLFKRKFGFLTLSSIIFFFLFLAVSPKQLCGRQHPVILIIFQVREVLLDGKIKIILELGKHVSQKKLYSGGNEVS